MFSVSQHGELFLNPLVMHVYSIQIELLSITNHTTSKGGAEVVCGWGCKCVVVTNSSGATAHIDSSFLSADLKQVVCGLNRVGDDVSGDLDIDEVSIEELHQSASPAQVS